MPSERRSPSSPVRQPELTLTELKLIYDVFDSSLDHEAWDQETIEEMLEVQGKITPIIGAVTFIAYRKSTGAVRVVAEPDQRAPQ